MAEADKKKTVVLIAIDESQHSRRAFDYYQNEVADENHEVILVHMFTPPAPPAMSSKERSRWHIMLHLARCKRKMFKLKKIGHTILKLYDLQSFCLNFKEKRKCYQKFRDQAMKVAGKEERSNRHHSHPFGHDFFLSDTGSEHWKKWRAKVEHKINELKKLLTTYEEICDEHRIMNRAILHSGDPGEGICELAKENEVDLIIIGSRGLNKLRRTFLGSVSDFVIRESGKSVLVVPPK
ncbi:uncharacterized protein LOC130636317 isoform X2 [Hydractinia symbiolongicarpus]|uniref:uncharacterized protein LOC130636317 isoform X2 n=1 Tax=Hydractinia symbiolongicarpus TaxID=13093 RepID=UPI00254C4151|nr:uncharacterized protein LOC130636317 isoform X2 [Hydractinia symbiolongicarpus]